MKKFFITRPDHDAAVSYLYSWGEEVIAFSKKSNIPCSDFRKEKANKEEVHQFLAKQFPRLVMLNGHGSRRTIAGHKDEPLITMDQDEEMLASAITYAVACDAAAELGKSIIKKGGLAFIGYEGPFGFAHQASRECTPAKDTFAEPFKLISNQVILALLQGHTVEKAYEKSQQLCSKLIKSHSTSDGDPESQTIRFWLFWDKYFQRLYGEETAKF